MLHAKLLVILACQKEVVNVSRKAEVTCITKLLTIHSSHSMHRLDGQPHDNERDW